MKILVVDHGLCTEAAIKLAEDGHTVGYHTPAYALAFPKCVNSAMGLGLKGLERVDNFWSAVDRADLIVSFDTFSQDELDYCLKHKKPIFGPGPAENLEHDRAKTKTWLKTKGLPVGPYTVCHGMTELIHTLKTTKDVWVKIDRFRGDVETFHHKDWLTTRNNILGPLLSSFGPYGEKIDFILEEPIESDIEVGFDGFVIKGDIAMPGLIGFEDKDKSYIGRVVHESDIPEPLCVVNDALEDYFTDLETSSLFSTEIRIGKDGKGYLIDPCIRAPHPPLAVELEMYGNFADLVTGANDTNNVPDMLDQYGCAVEIYSSESSEHWLRLDFDYKYRDQIKLQQACMIDGVFYSLPGSFIVATVVGTSSTVDKAIAECCKALETFKCEGMHHDINSLHKIKDVMIPAGEKKGIKF